MLTGAHTTTPDVRTIRRTGPVGLGLLLLILGRPCPTPADSTNAPAPLPVPVSLHRETPPPPLPALIGIADVATWRVEGSTDDRRTLVSPDVASPGPWNELVVSWNIHPARDTGLRVEAQALLGTRDTAFYSLGTWSPGAGTAPWERTSDRAPGDADGRVKTDTLSLATTARGVRLRLTLAGELARDPRRLRSLILSFSDTRTRPLPRPSNPRAWGTTLDVPERSQIAYPGGEAWCSPTCISMLLGWWSGQLGTPSLDHEVPDVAREVHDPAWQGTGNWPFNTAFAGSLGGLVACAARLPDLRAVEDLIAAGIPVALSVNAPALRGESGRENGHLILAVGFTAEGDLVANDPYARLDRGQRVRRIYRRPHVEAAWNNSHRLAYLVAPESRQSVLPVSWLPTPPSPVAPPTSEPATGPGTATPR